MLSQLSILDPLVATIVHPGHETGCFAAWGLDFGEDGNPVVTVVPSPSAIPTRMPARNEVFIWYGAQVPGLENSANEAALPSLSASSVLSDQEIRRAIRFVLHADRWSYIAAHAMLRTMLASALHCTPRQVHFTRGTWGKPRLSVDHHGHEAAEGLQFNLSHTRGLVAVALAGRPVGIDVEASKTIPEIHQFAGHFFAPEAIAALRDIQNEQAKIALFFRFWTLGEAFIKTTGLGLEQDLKSFAFSPAGAPRLLRVTPGWGAAARWRFGLAISQGTPALSGP